MLRVLEHPFLSKDSCTESLLLLSKSQLLAADYLLRRTFDLKPPDPFLKQGSLKRSKSFHMSPSELVVGAVKLLWTLAGHRPVWEEDGGGGDGGKDRSKGEIKENHRLSSSVLAWDVLLTLLRGFHVAARLLSQLGLDNEANYYAGEGAKLAKSLQLQGW